MSETLLKRVPREDLSEGARMAWDALNELTGTPTFVDVFAQAPELLDFAMVQFYQNIFFDGRVGEKHKQLSRLRLSMNNGCRTCNLQNLIGVGNIGLALNNPHGELTPELHAKLRRHFSEAEILELGLCLSIIVGLVKLSFAFGLVEKEDYCEFGTQ